MLKNKVVILVLISLLCQGCYKDIVKENTPINTFEVFWHSMDERYVYFEEKHVDWDSVYNFYRPKISHSTSYDDLKLIFREILTRLNDGHISIQINSWTSLGSDSLHLADPWYRPLSLRYYFPPKDIDIFYDYPEPVYCAQLPNHITYLSVSSFGTSPSLDAIKKLISTHSNDNGFVIDMRSNVGGFFNIATDLLSLFCSADFIAGYQKIKTGPGHDSFSGFNKLVINGSSYIPANIPKVILMDSYVYSAGNLFCAFIHEVPNTIIIGTKSLGGGGSPYAVLLPNNWILSFPRNKLYNLQFQSLEAGVKPDIEINVPNSHWDADNVYSAPDPLIEKAIEYLNSK